MSLEAQREALETLRVLGKEIAHVHAVHRLAMVCKRLPGRQIG